MNISITTKGIRLSDRDEKYIERRLKKLSRFLPFQEKEIPTLSLLVRQHKKHSLNHSLGKVKKGHKSIDNPEYFDGILRLILPKKTLIANMLGKRIHDCLKDGFDELMVEVEKYKGIYFKNNSDFPDHKTIRKREI